MQTATTVARGAAALYAATVMTLVLNTLYLVLLTNYISLQAVGLVSLLNVVVVGVATLAVLALPLSGSGVSATPPAVTRFISQYITGQGPARRVYLLAVGVCSVLSLAAAFVISSPSIASLVAGPNETNVVFFASVDAVFYSFAQLGGYSMLGAGRATSAGKLMVASAVIRYVFASALLVLGFGPAGVFMGFAVGDAVMAALANFYSYRVVEHARIEGASLKPVFAYMTSVFFAAAMGFAVSQTDKLLAFFQQGLGNLALYNIAAVGAAVASFAPNAATNVLVPALSGQGSLDEQKRATLRTYTRYVTLTAAPMGFGLAAVSPFLLRVFGDAYVSAAPLMAAISLSIALTAITSVYSSSLLVDDRAHHFTVSSLAALVGLVVVAVLTVPALGLMGIALGRSAMLFIMLGSVAYFVRRRRMLVLDVAAYLKSIAASGIMAVFVFVALDSAEMMFAFGRVETVVAAAVMMPVGLVFYLGVMRWLKAFSLADVDFIEVLLPSWLRWFTRLARRLL
ncbi:MAG: polysaccharide biosynthesis C-terminal domain-containing protein [Nitrososphaerales archaeon]|nr:polysaccharide biosynthesis C-terminal domain-containing protein [Nitrososphaerales archaeon]